jgi:hypothetical protein
MSKEEDDDEELVGGGVPARGDCTAWAAELADLVEKLRNRLINAEKQLRKLGDVNQRLRSGLSAGAVGDEMYSRMAEARRAMWTSSTYVGFAHGVHLQPHCAQEQPGAPRRGGLRPPPRAHQQTRAPPHPAAVRARVLQPRVVLTQPRQDDQPEHRDDAPGARADERRGGEAPVRDHHQPSRDGRRVPPEPRGHGEGRGRDSSTSATRTTTSPRGREPPLSERSRSCHSNSIVKYLFYL